MKLITGSFNNRLKLNQCKTQLLHVGTWHQLIKINFAEIHPDDEVIKFSSVASNLGFVFDNNLSMHEQIKFLSSSCSHRLRKLSLIRNSVNKKQMNA